MEFTLHGAVKLNTITGFSKAADNLLVIKNPSGCAVCLRWSLLLVPGHKNLVNTNHGHRQGFQMVETHRASPGPPQLLFAFSVLTVLLIRNVDGFASCGGGGGGVYPKWVLKALGFSPIDQGPPCFVVSNGLLVVVEDIFSVALPHLLILKCAHGYYPGIGKELKVFPCEDHHLTDCLHDGAGSLCALPSSENLGEGKQSRRYAGSAPRRSVCCRSDLRLIQQKSGASLSLPTRAMFLRFLPLAPCMFGES